MNIQPTPWGHIIAISFLISGNLLGAGILALPVNTGFAGFFPALAAMIVFGGAMFFSALVLAREATQVRTENFNYPSLYEKYLGKTGKWIAVITNALILYGLLTAYIAGSSKIVASMIGFSHVPWWLMTSLTLLLTGITVLDMSIIKKYNVLLMCVMLGAFALLIGLGESKVQRELLFRKDWIFLATAVPIILTAFHFHNIIPTVCRDMAWNLRGVGIAMFIGMAGGFAINALWLQVGLGMLPVTEGGNSILAAVQAGNPATIPMGHILKSRLFNGGAILFTVIAIATSYLANGIGLMDFIADLTENCFHRKNRFLVISLTFLPPFIIALVNPDIFLDAINLVGGVGIVLLFGILPSVVAYRKALSRKMRFFCLSLMLLFSLAFCLEIAHETGLLKLSLPKEREYWHLEHEKPIVPSSMESIGEGEGA
ncbi:MAG TPA: aromatic amino acid transport family protein [Synergistaceae bacterium]|nr:aromatic amino acid transport family protein [Synergistaceae bacterium]HPJ24549.1 aromatic amino acid transport family protein [Synergistaceae bacterium]HPQ36306.1 aromatic amino acid transport family protein [Synergistaceae bacterium]